jgi:hypothetical protein
MYVLVWSGLALVMVIFLFYGIFPIPATVPQLTARRIQQVQLGMSPMQVVALLGRPYHMGSYKGSNSHSMANCADFNATKMEADVADTTSIEGFFQRAAADTAVHICDMNDDRRHERNSTFTYTRHGGVFWTYPMLWVHFDKQARVNSVYAKEYAGDDTCIYSLSAEASQYDMTNQEALSRLFDAGK